MHISPLAILPFGLMLAAIAVMPIAAPHFWHSNRNKLLVALCLSTPSVVYLLLQSSSALIVHTLTHEYIPFIVLMGALFTITGNIFVDADLEGTPRVNTTFLAIGAVLASIIGTTGAAMLLVRPLLHTNRERTKTVHTALFFILIVANTGGLCTPLGDPPLLMLYLRGVPFIWFLELAPVWLFVNGLLLGLYYFTDKRHHAREPASALAADRTNIIPLVIRGKHNFTWLMSVILTVALLNDTMIPALKSFPALGFAREIVIVLCALCSWLGTPQSVRRANEFSWHPFGEVAVLFLGIFLTMIPCIAYLQANAQTLGIHTPLQFYIATGSLSAVLDNAPTALTFYALALGLHLPDARLIAGVPDAILKAIAAASVLFGGMTYIGNAPNLLVKALAEHNGVRMPQFFGYARWALLRSLPLFAVAYLLLTWLHR